VQAEGEQAGSLVYLAETLKAELERAKQSKEKIEQNGARVSPRSDSESNAHSLHLPDEESPRKSSAKSPRYAPDDVVTFFLNDRISLFIPSPEEPKGDPVQQLVSPRRRRYASSHCVDAVSILDLVILEKRLKPKKSRKWNSLKVCSVLSSFFG
jgi:hypothetical protein